MDKPQFFIIYICCLLSFTVFIHSTFSENLESNWQFFIYKMAVSVSWIYEIATFSTAQCYAFRKIEHDMIPSMLVKICLIH